VYLNTFACYSFPSLYVFLSMLFIFFDSELDKYDGEWQDDVKWGRGKYFHAGTNEYEEGDWVNDERIQ
jgi:hypothetical protein